MVRNQLALNLLLHSNLRSKKSKAGQGVERSLTEDPYIIYFTNRESEVKVRPAGRLRIAIRALSNNALSTSSFLLLIVMPGATSSVLVTSSDALCY